MTAADEEALRESFARMMDGSELWTKDRILNWNVLDNRYPGRDFSERKSIFSEETGTFKEFLE